VSARPPSTTRPPRREAAAKGALRATFTRGFTVLVVSSGS